jgi:hypothetical protein
MKHQKILTIMKAPKSFKRIAILGTVTLAATLANAQYGLIGPWGGTSGGYSGPMNPAPLVGNSVLVAFDGQTPMFQYFPSTPGHTYELDWHIRLPDLGGNGYPIEGSSTTGPAQFNVNLGGNTASYLIQNRDTWGFYSMQVVASSTSTYLSWGVPAYVTIDGYFQRSESAFINDYTLSEVPEPATWGLALVSVATVVLTRRFARRPHSAITSGLSRNVRWGRSL